tara:strand:- start:18485 stop:19093 length:609 start_codon:yes stop_codon:yes gene_type:complete
MKRMKLPQNVHLFLLCGGQSRRMGRDKSSLLFQGTSFEQRTKRIALDAGVTDVCTVGGKGKDIVDCIPHRGPAAATIFAMNEAKENILNQAHALVLLPVDMPMLSAVLLHQLIGLSLSQQTSCYYNRDWFPLVIYKPVDYLEELNKLITDSPMPSMKALANVCHAQTVPLSSRLHLALLNVNTPHDFSQLQSLTQRGQTQIS